MGEAALMIGGFDKPEVDPLSSAVLYPESCSVPSLEAGLAGQVTFVIQDSTPTVATCGGELGGGKYTKDCVVLQASNSVSRYSVLSHHKALVNFPTK